jgi:hypothetical protein
MKIGILTQPLHNNYGGILQAYALQTVLKRMGHDVWTVDIRMAAQRKSRFSYLRILRALIKRLLLRYLFRRPATNRIWLSEKQRQEISKHTRHFIDENIRTTSTITTLSQLSNLKKYKFDVYIVGSDQVWRPKYSPGLTHFFLDFVDRNSHVKRISYAASFGVDNMEFTTEQIDLCGELLKEFDAISVREDSAVDLCNQYFGVHAIRVLDPTFLLNKEDYIALVKKDNIPHCKRHLVSYVLDINPDKRKIINHISAELGVETFYLNKLSVIDQKDNNENIFPPVTEWLRGFMDAEFIITDSFHGTAFSIIFNKPFLSIGNEGRGMTRFTSVLKLFDLEDRLINSSVGMNEKLIKQSIDWNHVNTILFREKEESIRYLLNAIAQESSR